MPLTFPQCITARWPNSSQTNRVRPNFILPYSIEGKFDAIVIMMLAELQPCHYSKVFFGELHSDTTKVELYDVFVIALHQIQS